MKNLFLVIISFFFITVSVSAQGRNGLLKTKPQSEGQFLLAVGPANLLGDIGGANRSNFQFIRDFKFRDTRPLFSLGFRQTFNQSKFGWKAMFQYGYFVGDDAGFRNAPRDYGFEASILQATLNLEYSFIKTQLANRSRSTLRFYAFTGVGGSNSASKITKGPAYPRPNDKTKVSELAMYIPVGVGGEVKLSKNFKLGAELYWNYYFSDYMEGLTTGDSKYNDTMFGLSVSLGYRIFGSDGRPNQNKCRCSWE